MLAKTASSIPKEALHARPVILRVRPALLLLNNVLHVMKTCISIKINVRIIVQTSSIKELISVKPVMIRVLLVLMLELINA